MGKRERERGRAGEESEGRERKRGKERRNHRERERERREKNRRGERDKNKREREREEPWKLLSELVPSPSVPSRRFSWLPFPAWAASSACTINDCSRTNHHKGPPQPGRLADWLAVSIATRATLIVGKIIINEILVADFLVY